MFFCKGGNSKIGECRMKRTPQNEKQAEYISFFSLTVKLYCNCSPHNFYLQNRKYIFNIYKIVFSSCLTSLFENPKKYFTSCFGFERFFQRKHLFMVNRMQHNLAYFIIDIGHVNMMIQKSTSFQVI